MRRTRVRLALFTAALVCALSVTGLALASNFTPPVLKSPHKNAHVNPGRVTLRVYDPGLSGDSAPVYVTINPHRKLNKYGHLSYNCSLTKGCDFRHMTKWKGHPGWWNYTGTGFFPGFWSVTKGKYYWQAEHVAAGNECRVSNECELVSPIHVFYVR